MVMTPMEQTTKLLEMMWGNWEDGFKKVYDSQQEFGKASMEAFKKQEDVVNSIKENLNKVEEEVKNYTNSFSQSLKESSKAISDGDAAHLFQSWNEKMVEITNRIQQLSATPNKSLQSMVEQSQSRMLESVKKASEEQNKLQTKMKEIIDNFMVQVKESQGNLVEATAEKAKQAFEELQPRLSFTMGMGMGEMQSQHSVLLEKSKKVVDKPFDSISVGDTATYTRKVTNQDVLDFATLTEDVNPIHIDEDFAAKTMFKGRIAHGILTAGFISTLIGTILPGKNVIYLSQNCKFTSPVRIGDTLRVVGEITDKRSDKKILTIQTNVYNQNDELVLEGSAVVMKKEQS